MISKSIRILSIIIVVYAALYLASMVSSFYKGELSFTNLKDILLILYFVIFIAGIVLLWTKKKTAGIIFMTWNAGIWIYDLWLNRGRDSGMLSIMAVPVMVVGTLFFLEWHKSSNTLQPSVPQQWKFILRVLLINYAVLYSIVVISELSSVEHTDYYSLPFILFPLMFLVFILGFAFSWKREFYAGIIFLAWYAILLLGSVAWFEFRDSGPWILFGIPVLLQGLFYIKNYLWYKSG
jgi:hypothetical protein